MRWVGVATLLTALAWFAAFGAWIEPGLHIRYDYAEPFIRVWSAMTWIGQGALWLATLSVGRIWIPLVLIGAAATGIQILIGVTSAWIGIADGIVGPLGALLGALSIAQMGLVVAWMVLIARSRMRPA